MTARPRSKPQPQPQAGQELVEDGYENTVRPTRPTTPKAPRPAQQSKTRLAAPKEEQQEATGYHHIDPNTKSCQSTAIATPRGRAEKTKADKSTAP